jgi:hypothetical protein
MQENEMLKSGIQVIKKKDLCYIAESEKSIKRIKPWLRYPFSFLYDFIMKSSIFPKKFGGDMSKHYEILSQELKGVHGKRVLELATGSGSAVNFLPNDNQYTGTDMLASKMPSSMWQVRMTFPSMITFSILPFVFSLCIFSTTSRKFSKKLKGFWFQMLSLFVAFQYQNGTDFKARSGERCIAFLLKMVLYFITGQSYSNRIIEKKFCITRLIKPT